MPPAAAPCPPPRARCPLPLRLSSQQGLGKTLQTLMLALTNPPPPGWAVRSLEGVQASEGEPTPIKTSLVVVPANLLGQVGGWRAGGGAQMGAYG